MLNYSNLPFAGFPFDELRGEAASQDLRATVVIGVPVFRYTSASKVVRRRAKPLVLSKGETLQLDGPADSERMVFVGLGTAFRRGPIHHRFQITRRSAFGLVQYKIGNVFVLQGTSARFFTSSELGVDPAPA